ncbi:isocitrate lyase/PEP mutase family protein [Roseinatronobacter alkalisoli]|uniref:Isocitrate lyase/PEP mutase family protein n=1 Tax=Roseinatronobacter alkalisoli TaxID=3028235 RepID=A0ABT5T7R6_9RHOB|nr:isocitrate lyase/PEP mutase family protein [Roseinatronobacter sp. HJB301]MDD7971016.1 isocitrate lyase/PEP mutase family protein [Roseinatronobacter sp. HJB301]
MMRQTGLLDGAERLRERLAEGGLLTCPGAADALTARLVSDAGFAAVYMTGLGATASRLGTPDLGLMTQSEMADQARAMVRACDLPVIADADTGYGGPLNVRRMIQDYAMAGVAALHIEDQESPKRCGQLAGVRLISPAQAVDRLRAAVAARSEMQVKTVLIGRTDALQPEGLSAALERAKAYRDTGVDLVFVDGVKTRAEVDAIARGIDGPKVISLVDGTDAATLRFTDLQEMGFSVALYAVTALFGAIAGMRMALSGLGQDQRPANPPPATYAEYAGIVDLQGYQQFSHDHEDHS